MSGLTKEPKETSKGTKVRVSLSLEEDAIRKGEELAKRERRSLSNLLEVLVDKEHDRVFPLPLPANPAEQAA